VIAIKSEIKNIISKYSFEHYTIETDFKDEFCDFAKEL